MKKTYLFLTLQLLSFYLFSLNITIIESQSFNSGHVMDTKWSAVATSMGHTPTIVPQTTLDNTAFFATTDILIVSSGVIFLPANRIATILQFLQTGKPVYIQSEYLSSYSTNQGFQSIVTSLGGVFNWTAAFSGNLIPMNVLGSFATRNNAVPSLGYYWYSVAGVGDCNTENILQYGGAYHGFQYIPSNSSYGSIITTTDQDWVNQSTSPQLQQNLITHLILPDTITSSQTAVVNLGNDTTLCQGATLNLNATNAGATYQWQDNSTSATYTVTQQGTYWVKVTNSCGSKTDTIHVNYTSVPIFNLGNDTTLCQGSTLNLNATTSNATYLWQDNSTNATYTVTQQGIYWVKVTTSCGNKTDSITVNYNPLPPAINLGNDTTLCQGATLNLNATNSNVTYQWQDNSTSATYTVTQQGTYWVKITNSCGSKTDSINVAYNSIPTINLGNDTTLCQGSTLNLNATTSNATYLWQDNSTNATYTVTQQGIYWVKVTNVCGSKTDSITVNYNPLPPTINLGNDTTLCQGATLDLNATNANVTYQWQDNSTNATYSVTQQGTYWVKITNSCGSKTDTIHINYNSIPTTNLGHDTTVCQGSTLNLNATSSNATTYLWQDNSTGSTFTVSQQGTYWVKATNNCGSKTDSITVNYNPLPPIINLGNDTTLCQGATLILNATSSNVTYLWQNNSTSPTFTVTQQGTYWVKTTNNCGSNTSTIHVQYNPLPPAINLGNDTTLCQGTSLNLNATTSSNVTYLWQDNSTASTYSVTQQGIYWVKITNSCGSKSDSITIQTKECQILFEMPNVFTPNGDGINDFFNPKEFLGINNATLVIYNRWGQKVIETTNLLVGWDGKYNNKDCPDGTYYWLVKYTDVNENTLEKNGFLTLIR